MKYVPLNLPPGLYRNGTDYQAKGRWTDGHLIRWLPDGSRYPPCLPVGGWSIIRDTNDAPIQASGFPRGSHSWRGNDGSAWLGLGTNTKAYAYSQNVLTDITPGGLVTGSADGSLLSGGIGWGEGGWGEGPWGGSAIAGSYVDADTWSLDNFGEYLVGCLTSDGKLYSWDRNVSNDFTQMAGSPSSCRALVVTPERFVMALGAGGDPRKAQWADRESLTTWTPSASNKAGSQVLQTNGRLICGRRTARETLLFTDADLWGAVFIGGTFVYSFQQRGDNCGIIGPNAVAIAEGAAYWMADGLFFVYDGAVRQIPCEVSDYVFEDLNRLQRTKITAVPVAQFGEVWWFYPSASGSGLENDRYVALNYRQGFWMTGNIGRAAGSGAGVYATPMLWTYDGKLYAHETGDDRAGEIPFLEGLMELGEGDRIVHVLKLIPDERTLGNAEASFRTRFQPMGDEYSFGPYQVGVETDVRLSGREIVLRLAEAIEPALFADGSEEADGSALASGQDGQNFRIGSFKLGVAVGSRR